jgi:hypothetical protein
MTVSFTIFIEESDEDEEYSSFVDFEDFEDEEEEPQGFNKAHPGSDLTSSTSSEGPVPWDPS